MFYVLCWRFYFLLVCNSKCHFGFCTYLPSMWGCFGGEVQTTDPDWRGVYIFFFWCNSNPWVMVSSFTRFLDHTQRRTTVGRTPLDEWSARRRDFYLISHNIQNRQTSMPPGGIWAAADLRLRQRGHWDRFVRMCSTLKCIHARTVHRGRKREEIKFRNLHWARNCKLNRKCWSISKPKTHYNEVSTILMESV